MQPTDFTYLLEQAQRRVSRQLDSSLAQIGASGEQWRVLEVLADEAGRPIGELARLLLMHPPTMTKLIDKMVASGCVQRIADMDDSRRVLVFITDKGLEMVSKLASRADSFHADLSAEMSPENTALLAKILSRLAAARV